jgi:hypothetical protein
VELASVVDVPLVVVIDEVAFGELFLLNLQLLKHAHVEGKDKEEDHKDTYNTSGVHY